MADLIKYTNIYADLSQSTYNGRNDLKGNPYNFANGLRKKQQQKLQKGESVRFIFKNAKDIHGNDVSKVYLQPDKSVKTVEDIRTMRVPKINGGYEEKPYLHATHQKGLLTDEKAGFNAYFVTDTPKLSEKTKNTYFAIRGSDAMGIGTLNDWWDNDAQFALKNAHIPQAKLATKAIHQKIKELRRSAPNAKISITGHSLGTIVSIQAVANLPERDLDKIDRVVLFQGPDARESIEKMGKQAQANIQKLEAAGKIDYYVNPFDLVSMLNRNRKGVDEIGHVHYMLPKSYTSSFDQTVKNGSSHDFGQYQIDANGNIQVASIKEQPELFAAGQALSQFVDRTLNQLDKLLGKGTMTGMAVLGVISSGGTNVIADMIAATSGALTYQDAKNIYEDYLAIIKKAQIEKDRRQKIQNLQNRIHSASGGEKIQLQEELVREVAAQAKAFGEEYQGIVENILVEAEEEVDQVVSEVHEAVWSIQHYLSAAEVESLIADFQKEAVWDTGIAQDDKAQAKAYQHRLTEVGDKLNQAAHKLKGADQQAANLFKK